MGDAGGSRERAWSELGSAAAPHAPPLLHQTPLPAALRVEVNEWPPYLSNLMFELWEVPAAGGGSGGGGGGDTPASRFVVRVLLNQQVLPLPGEAGTVDSSRTRTSMDYVAFKTHVLGPFILSGQDHAQACSVKLMHDSPMPKPVSAAAPSDD